MSITVFIAKPLPPPRSPLLHATSLTLRKLRWYNEPSSPLPPSLCSSGSHVTFWMVRTAHAKSPCNTKRYILVYIYRYIAIDIHYIHALGVFRAVLRAVLRLQLQPQLGLSGCLAHFLWPFKGRVAHAQCKRRAQNASKTRACMRAFLILETKCVNAR